MRGGGTPLRRDVRHRVPPTVPPGAQGIELGRLILAAPDIDSASSASEADVFRRMAEGATLYAPFRDLALQSSSVVHRGPRVGRRPVSPPPVGVNVTDAACEPDRGPRTAPPPGAAARYSYRYFSDSASTRSMSAIVSSGIRSWASVTSAEVGWASAGSHCSGFQAPLRISDLGQCG